MRAAWHRVAAEADQSLRAAPPGTSHRDTVLWVRLSVFPVRIAAPLWQCRSPGHGTAGHITPAEVHAEAEATEGQGDTSVTQCPVTETARAFRSTGTSPP